MLVEIKRLISRSAVYSVGNILLKAIGFFLLPIYTRLLTPSDYGILAVTSLVATILATVSPLSLHGFVSPLYFSTTDEHARRRGLGTLFVAVLVIGGAITLLADQLGGFLVPLIFRDVPYQPYIRLAIWTTYFVSWGLIPLTLAQTQEQSRKYILFTLSSSFVQIGLALWFVVYLRQGVYGMLVAYLVAAIIMVIPYTGLALRNLTLAFELDVLKSGLIFSLPLLPHALSSWILDISDRLILQWYVPLDQLGLYSMAYTYGTLIVLVATAMNFAWSPFLFRIDASEGGAASRRFGQFGTYFALILCLVALFLGLAAQPVITLITSPAYHAAGQIAPWIVAGQLLATLYFYPVNFLFLRRKTLEIPKLTAIAAIINVGLNLWLIPLFGVIAAAWTTFIANGVMLLLACWFASMHYPVVYEYKRLAILAAVTALLWFLGYGVSWTGFWFAFWCKLPILLLFPVLLSVLGFFSEQEKRYMGVIWTSISRRLLDSAR
jgi:O-antigen/teichoic acid export membrane protein